MARSLGAALLLVDVINDFDFEGSSSLVRAAHRVAPRIQALAAAARKAGAPVVYVNDNFGRWTSDFGVTIRECAREESLGRSICERLRPNEGDYFVLKPQHSGFYATPLELLLEFLGARTLVLAGFATDICIAFTANDAHMRGYHLVVPRDAVAANSTALTNAALAHIRRALGGSTPTVASVDFRALRKRQKKARGQTF